MFDHVRYSRARFITDAVGHVMGSYTAFGASYVIDNVSHTPSNFSHVLPVCFAAVLILADYICAIKVGNGKWFGLVSLLVATVSGYVGFVCLVEAFSVLSGRSGSGDLYFFVGWILVSPIFLIPTLLIPLIVRLLPWPILNWRRLECNWITAMNPGEIAIPTRTLPL